MNTSVSTKTKKKESLSAEKPQPATVVDDLRVSLLSLENACARILENDYAEGRLDSDGLYWQQRLMNIAKPVSLALAESNGPRHFHGHYRHRKDDESILHPVLEDPIEALAQTCEHALQACDSKLVGMQDQSLLRSRHMLESALQGFLNRYSHLPK
jgi:hypothetical protein